MANALGTFYHVHLYLLYYLTTKAISYLPMGRGILTHGLTGPKPQGPETKITIIKGPKRQKRAPVTYMGFRAQRSVKTQLPIGRKQRVMVEIAVARESNSLTYRYSGQLPFCDTSDYSSYTIVN